MASKAKWHERLFGKQLIICSTIKDNNDCELINTSEALNNVVTTGIYFSFANINAQSDGVTKHLVELFHRLNGASAEEHLHGNSSPCRLQVVQVVLWANNDIYGDFEKSHRECIQDMPWCALPYSEIDLKTRLSRRYRIKVGVPTLVLLDEDGTTITCCATEQLVKDPQGETFPWKPRPVDQVLKDVCITPGRLYDAEHPDGPKGPLHYQDLSPDIVRGFYFSAHWCPPCRAFTPQLIETYKLVRKKHPNFEVIFVSSDRSADSFDIYTSTMPWLTVPYQHIAIRAELAQLYAVRGIPTLLLVDGNGHVVTHDARTEMQDDPKAQNFPWKPRPVNILTDRFANKLHDYPAIVLFIEGDESETQFADSVLAPAADIYYKKYNINFNAPQEEFLYANETEHYIQFLIGLDSETSDIMRDLIGLDEVVPLLVGIDVPNNRFAVMDYGLDISVDSVCDFVEKFQKNELQFKHINEQLCESNPSE